MLDDVVGHRFRIARIPCKRDAGGRALRHHGSPRSLGQRYEIVEKVDLF